MQKQPTRRIPIAAIACISAALLAAWGCADDTPQSPTKPPVTTSAQVKPSPQAVQPRVEKKVEVYWLKNTGNRIEVVSNQIAVKDADKSTEVLESAFNRLLAGPTDPAFASTIPKGTKLRSVKVQDDGVYVDLSKEFTTGGGTASMSGRMAQVLYTATSLNPNAKVWIDVEGKKLEVLGGEGIEVDRPMTRKSFEQNFDL